MRIKGNPFAEYVGRRVTYKHKNGTLASSYVGKVISVTDTEVFILFDGGHEGWRSVRDLEIVADQNHPVVASGRDA